MSDGLPQFSTAEFAAGGRAPCKGCGRPIEGSFFQVNGQAVCEACTQTLRSQVPQDSHGAFVRAVLFGMGAALLGLVIYVLFALSTGLVIGFVSLAVGYLVGKALLLGSGGVRGRRYQLAAVLLTYLAVSLSAVPIALYHLRQQAPPQSSPAVPGHTVNAARAVGIMAVLGLASPFLELKDPVHGLIGLVILFVGLRIAWRLTAAPRLDIVGPLSPAPPRVAIT